MDSNQMAMDGSWVMDHFAASTWSSHLIRASLCRKTTHIQNISTSNPKHHLRLRVWSPASWKLDLHSNGWVCIWIMFVKSRYYQRLICTTETSIQLRIVLEYLHCLTISIFCFILLRKLLRQGSHFNSSHYRITTGTYLL